MKFIKRRKYTLILLIVFVLLVFLAVKVKEVLMPDEGRASYGDRLDERDNYPISDDIYNKITEDYGKDTNIKQITHNLSGKIIKFFITVDDKVSVKDAKALGEKLITYFDEATLSYYSVQVYVLKADKSLNNFPIIGMKDPLSTTISWTKDRDIVTESDTDETKD